MSWFGESKRHSLSAKGIKTNQKLPKVNLNRYLGRWYSIENTPVWFQKGCVKAFADYSLNKEGNVKVKNSCVNEEGKLKFATAIAYPTSSNRLEVDFVGGRIFTGSYNIVHLDKDYKNAIVMTDDKKTYWILSRKKSLDKKTLDRLRQKVEKIKGKSQ